MSRYLSGRVRSSEITTALSVLMGAPAPGTLHLGDEDIRAWLDLGTRAKEVAPVWFGRHLEWLTHVVTDLEQKRLLHD